LLALKNLNCHAHGEKEIETQVLKLETNSVSVNCVILCQRKLYVTFQCPFIDALENSGHSKESKRHVEIPGCDRKYRGSTAVHLHVLKIGWDAKGFWISIAEACSEDSNISIAIYLSIVSFFPSLVNYWIDGFFVRHYSCRFHNAHQPRKTSEKSRVAKKHLSIACTSFLHVFLACVTKLSELKSSPCDVRHSISYYWPLREGNSGGRWCGRQL
jgi:hypothetical protein